MHQCIKFILFWNETLHFFFNILLTVHLNIFIT